MDYEAIHLDHKISYYYSDLILIYYQGDICFKSELSIINITYLLKKLSHFCALHSDKNDYLCEKANLCPTDILLY